MKGLLGSILKLADALAIADRISAKSYRIDPGAMRCLRLLERLGPAHPKDLASALGYSTGSITTVIDRLQLAGLVSREASADRRKVLVVPKTKGIKTESWERELAQRMADVSDDDLRQLAVGLRSLRQALHVCLHRVK